MSKPEIAALAPARVALENGKRYFYCTCGKSDGQPFCDGSHKGSEFSPSPFVAEASEQFSLCQCKQTRNPPYCDGSHMALRTKPAG